MPRKKQNKHADGNGKNYNQFRTIINGLIQAITEQANDSHEKFSVVPKAKKTTADAVGNVALSIRRTPSERQRGFEISVVNFLRPSDDDEAEMSRSDSVVVR